MDPEKRESLQHLRDLADDDDFDAGNIPNAPDMVNMDDILDGTTQVEMSHAEEDSGDDNDEVRAKKAQDWRTRRDRTERRNIAFLSQMGEMGESVHLPIAEGVQRGTVEEYDLQVVDMFDTRILMSVVPDTTDVSVKLDPRGGGVAPALILAGFAFWRCNRVTHVRCPQLAVQSFVKSLCDIHGSLGRDSSWRLKHACPACMHKLEGEDRLIFDMLTTMDGNDSLKRVLRREKSYVHDEGGEPTLAKSSERVDNRDAGDGYIISRERVDRWAKTRLAAVLPMQTSNLATENPCADRWKNMVNDVTSKMWGIFDETGVFLALCRHGFVLVLADMIRSGELAKYPLAVVEELLDAFGLNLGAGYDVGCHFGATVANSELGPLARENNLKCLVGSFHGHAHNRLCQLKFLATYVEGMGLEDLEGCERFFSRSNGLAKSCRYASRFHRQQEITTYVKHFDSAETYANLSKFLCTNYRQALGILKTEATLVSWMKQEGVKDYAEFHSWLEEETTYLTGLKDAPKTNVETMEMEAKYSIVFAEAKRARGDNASYAPGVPKAELARRHAKERVERDLDSVRELEGVLDIAERWTTRSTKWGETTEAIKKRKYQLALDALELLIVERIFELTKMNQSETGYKMRKHIAKALQARSKAVRNAIDRFNAAACMLSPPMPQISWEQVVDYAFLADFDLLRDTDAEIRAKPWTRPAYRMAMDRYFKTLRAREEIRRLNVEIPRVITWIRDENHVLRTRERDLRETDGKTETEIENDVGMAVQIRLYRERRGRFDAQHMRRFWALAKIPGFTGSLVPGFSVERRAAEREAAAARVATEGEESGREATRWTWTRGWWILQ
ncbi:hypothetical protein C8R43DRAFT_953380 [Mycena crocata]|nr:hypothetical protein C8R43DRAFT_953380 [Mycena crocata]